MSFISFLLPRGSDILHIDVDQSVLGQDAGFVEEVLDHFEEARILSSRISSQNRYFYANLRIRNVLEPIWHGESPLQRVGGAETPGGLLDQSPGMRNCPGK